MYVYIQTRALRNRVKRCLVKPLSKCSQYICYFIQRDIVLVTLILSMTNDSYNNIHNVPIYIYICIYTWD